MIGGPPGSIQFEDRNSAASRDRVSRERDLKNPALGAMLRSVTRANKCVGSLSEGAEDRRTVPREPIGLNFPSSGPSVRATAPSMPWVRLQRQEGAEAAGTPVQQQELPPSKAAPPRQQASKLVKFYGETVLCVAFSEDEQLFAVAGQLGHVILYCITTGDEVFRHRLPRKVGVTALVLSGPSDDLKVLFGTFMGEFHAFRFCLSTASLYVPQPASVPEPKTSPPASVVGSEASPRSARWSGRHSRASVAGGRSPLVPRVYRRAEAEQGRLDEPASTEGSPARPSPPASPLSRRRLLSLVSGKALLGGAAPCASDASREPSLGPSSRETPFSWNETLGNCALECLALSSELGLIFMAGKTEWIAVYEAAVDKERDVLGFTKRPQGVTHCAKVSSIGIGAQGELLAVGGESATVELYAARTGQLLRTLVLQAQTASLAISRDGAALAVGTAASVKLFAVRWAGPKSADGPHASKTLELPQGVSAGMVAFSEDGSNLAIAGEIGQERVVSIVSTSTGATMRQARFDERVRCCALDTNGGRLLIGTFARTAELYYGGSGATMRHFGAANDTIRCVFMLPSRSLLAVAGDAHGNGTVYVYHVKAAKQRGNAPLFRLPRRKPAWSVNISPDGLWLTVGGYDARVAVYSLRSLLSRAVQYGGDVSEVPPVQELSFTQEKGGPGFVWSSAFSADGSTFVVGSWSGAAYVYDVSPEATAAERALAEEDAAVVSERTASSAAARVSAVHASQAAADAVERAAALPATGGGIDWSSGADMPVLVERCRVPFTRGERVYAVAVSATGDRMAVAGRDASVLMYHIPPRRAGGGTADGPAALSGADAAMRLSRVSSAASLAEGAAPQPRRLWTAEGRDFVYTVALTNQYCAFAGTGRMVYVVSATTGDLLVSLPVSGTVQSLHLHRNSLAVGVQEAGIVVVYDIATGVELICLPSVFGAVHSVRLDDEALSFASGHQATMYGGGGDFAWSQVPDYYVAAALIHGEKSMSLRCLSSILRRHPEIVNCRHPRDRHTFLQYATMVVTEPAVMRLLVEGLGRSGAATSTKIGLLQDLHGNTALDTALRMGGRTWIRLLVDAVISGRVLSLPSSLEPVVHCFPQLAREHPKDFIRLICRMPLSAQHEMFWPWIAGPIDSFLTRGSPEPILARRWRLARSPTLEALEGFLSGRWLARWLCWVSDRGGAHHAPRARRGGRRRTAGQARDAPKPAAADAAPAAGRPSILRPFRPGMRQQSSACNVLLFEDEERSVNLSDEARRAEQGGASAQASVPHGTAGGGRQHGADAGGPPTGVAHGDRMRQLLLGTADAAAVRGGGPYGYEMYHGEHDADICGSSCSSDGSDFDWLTGGARGGGCGASFSASARSTSALRTPMMPQRFIGLLRASVAGHGLALPGSPLPLSANRNLTPQLSRENVDSHELSAVGENSAAEGLSIADVVASASRRAWPRRAATLRRRSSCGLMGRLSSQESISDPSALTNGGASPSQVVIDVDAPPPPPPSAAVPSSSAPVAEGLLRRSSLPSVFSSEPHTGSDCVGLCLSPKRLTSRPASPPLRSISPQPRSKSPPPPPLPPPPPPPPPPRSRSTSPRGAAAPAGEPSSAAHASFALCNAPGAVAAAGTRPPGDRVSLRRVPLSNETRPRLDPSCSQMSCWTEGARSSASRSLSSSPSLKHRDLAGFLEAPVAKKTPPADARERPSDTSSLDRARLAIRRRNLAARMLGDVAFSGPVARPAEPPGAPAPNPFEGGDAYHEPSGGLPKGRGYKRGARRRASVRVYTVPWRGWASRVGAEAPLALLVDAVRATNDRSAFQSVAVQALLEFKWRAFGRPLFLSLLATYLVGLVATLLQAVGASKMLVLRHGLAAGGDADVEQYWYEMTLGPAQRSAHGPPVNSFLLGRCFPADLRIESVADAWRASNDCQTVGGLHIYTPLFVLTSVRGIFFLYLESIQLRQGGLKAHMHEAWNFFDLLNALLPLAVNALMLMPGTWTPSSDSSQPVLCYTLRVGLAASCLLGGIKLLWYGRASFRIGPLVTMFVEILTTNILPFLLLLTVTVVSFAFALHVLVGPRDIFFADPISAIFMTWGLSLYVRSDHNHMNFRGGAPRGSDFYGANSHLTHGQDSTVSIELIVYELLMVLVQIVLLNLLIAIMSDTYTRARERIALTSRYEKAQIIWELELYMMWIHSFAPTCAFRLFFAEGSDLYARLFPDWLHFCVPDDARLLELDLLPPSHATPPSRQPGAEPESAEPDSAPRRSVEAASAMALAERNTVALKDTSTKILALKAYLLQMLDALGVDADAGAQGLGESQTTLSLVRAEIAEVAASVGAINGRLDSIDTRRRVDGSARAPGLSQRGDAFCA